jgi:hypothetical protein
MGIDVVIKGRVSIHQYPSHSPIRCDWIGQDHLCQCGHGIYTPLYRGLPRPLTKPSTRTTLPGSFTVVATPSRSLRAFAPGSILQYWMTPSIILFKKKILGSVKPETADWWAFQNMDIPKTFS